MPNVVINNLLFAFLRCIDNEGQMDATTIYITLKLTAR